MNENSQKPISKKKLGVKVAFEKGYRVINNEVIFNGKARKLYKHIKRSDLNDSAYYSFGIRGNDGKRIEIYVHQLLGYQKFGDLFFNEEMEVRHIDGNFLNNSEDNLAIGDRSDTRRDYLKRVNQL